MLATMRITVLLLLVSLSAVACRQSEIDSGTQPAAATGPVTVKVLGPGLDRVFVVESVVDGTTVESFLRSLAAIPIEIRGSGTTAFVESINGISTGAESGWTYRIDGDFVPRGVGAVELHPPTTLEWRYGEWEEQAEGKTE